MVICGTHAIPWTLFQRRVRSLRGLSSGDLSLVSNIVDMKYAFDRFTMAKSRRGSLFWRSQLNTSDRLDDAVSEMCVHLIITARQKVATEQHDRVYGLYAIAQALSLQVEAPDYSRRFQEVCEDFVVALMRRTESLMPMSYFDVPVGHPGWPSWVPNIAAELKGSGRQEIVNIASAGRELLRSGRLLHVPGRLTIEGIRLAKIVRVATGYPEFRLLEGLEMSLDEVDVINAALRLGHALDFNRNASPPTGDGRDARLNHKLGEKPFRDRWRILFPETAVSRIERLWALYSRHVSRDKVNSPNENLEFAMIAILGDEALCIILHDLHGRYFEAGWLVPIVLADGCDGWVKSGCQISDSVYLCYGAVAPLLLRELGKGECKLIGPCRIAGIPLHLWPLDHSHEHEGLETITLA